MFLFSHVCLNYRANCPKPVSSLDWVPLFSLQKFGFLSETFQTLALLRVSWRKHCAFTCFSVSSPPITFWYSAEKCMDSKVIFFIFYFFCCPLLPSCVQLCYLRVMEKKCESDNKKRKESRMWVWFQGFRVMPWARFHLFFVLTLADLPVRGTGVCCGFLGLHALYNWYYVIVTVLTIPWNP